MLQPRLLPFLVSCSLIINVGAQNTWEPFGVGASVQSITTIDDAILVSSYGAGGGMLRSQDDGANWEPAINGLPSNLVRSVGRSGGFLFAGHNTGIHRSADGGDSWELMNTGIPAGTTYAAKFFEVGNLTLAVMNGSISSGGGIYRSTNGGTSWSMGHSGMSTNLAVHHIDHDATGIYAATSVGIYRSVDQALSWQLLGSVNYITYSLQIVGGRIIAITSFGVLRTDDYGATWSTAATGAPTAPARGELVAYDGKLYAIISTGPGSSQVYRSLDNGASFSVFNNGLSATDQLNQNQFHADQENLYLGALNDVYALPGSTVGIAGAQHHSITIHPTVFMDAFAIDLSSNSGNSSVHLIDMNGKIVLSKDGLPASQIRIERGTLAAGIYSCIIIDHSTGNRFFASQVIAQ